MDILRRLLVPRLMRRSTPVNDSLSGASSLCSTVGSSVNAESSSGSFNVLVSSTMLYFGWPIAASVPTSRGISFGLLWLGGKTHRASSEWTVHARKLSLRIREPTDALVIWPLRELLIPEYGSLSRVQASPRAYSSQIRSFLFSVRVTVL